MKRLVSSFVPVRQLREGDWHSRHQLGQSYGLQAPCHQWAARLRCEEAEQQQMSGQLGCRSLHKG